MLRLAVSTNKETLQRITAPLTRREIEPVYINPTERVICLTGNGQAYPPVDVGFVYPSRLMEGGVADACLNIPWVNDHSAIVRSRNKAGVLARLDNAGIPTPDSVFVSNPVDESTLASVFERFDPPVVLKPNSATRGVGVTQATDLDSFLGICDYLGLIHAYPATGDRSFIVQEFMPNASDYRVMVLNGEYVGAVERQSPSNDASKRWKHNVHQGANATSIDLPVSVRNLAEQTAACLDIDWLGVDILETDDRIVVSETNARPTVDVDDKYVDDFYDRLASLIQNTAE